MLLEECKYGQYFLLNNSKVYVKTDDSATLYSILNYEYPEILRSMLFDEFYILQNSKYDFVKEIRYMDIVVGFIALDYYDDSLIMKLCYILPDYRGKGLFVEELSVIKDCLHNDIWLNLPNRFVIESLICNGFAEFVNDFLVKSSFPLSFVHPLFDSIRCVSFFYDLRVCAVVDFDYCLVSPLLDVDVFCFNADYYRSVLFDDFYFRRLM